MKKTFEHDGQVVVIENVNRDGVDKVRVATTDLDGDETIIYVTPQKVAGLRNILTRFVPDGWESELA